MINQLELVINSKPYELPKLEELFCFGCSHEIIDGSYKGKNYGNGNGKKLLSMLNEKTKLLFHKKIETLKGSRNSDYSFNIEEHEYIFEYDNMKLTIKVSTPRNQKNTKYYCQCE